MDFSIILKMKCFFGLLGVAIIWPLSGYYFLGLVGWLGTYRQQKIMHLLKKPHDWIDKRIPYLKFKNTKPISNNLFNIIENILIKFPLRLIITLPIIIILSIIGLAIMLYAVVGAGSCF